MAHNGMALICTQIMYWPTWSSFYYTWQEVKKCWKRLDSDNVFTKFHQIR